MASDGRYVYYGNPYPPAPSYEPPRPIRSDSGSSSSQPPQSPAQQHQHYPSQQPYSTPNHNASQSPYPAPSQQHQYSSGPNYMSPVASVPPQQWAQSSWGQQSYPRSDTQNYNPGPPPPIRSSSSEQSQPQRIWPHHTYPPPPPLESPQYPPSPTRSRSDEPQQRSYAPPPRPPPDSPPNTRPVHGHGSGSGAGHAPLPATHPSYHQPQSQVPTFPHRRPPPNTSPPLAADYRRRRRDSSPASAPPPPPPVAVPATVPAPAPTVAYPAYSPPTSNAIDFHKLVSSYHTILETGKTITLPRSVDGAMDRMLENASYAAQVLEGASSGSGQSSQSRAHGPARGSPSLASPPVKQHHQQPQLHRIHSASTVSSTSDIARSPSHPQSSARSPPPRTSANILARAQDPSSRDIKGKIKTTSPMSGKSVGSDVNAHGGSDTVPTAVPSKSQSQKLDDSGHAPAVPDSGSSSTRDPNHRSGSSSSSSGQKCLGCGATATPEWRRGPLGPRTLCNACGLVYAKLVKKRMREAGGSARTAGAYGSRISSSLKEESPEAESDEDDEEQSYDRTQISGR